MGRKYFEGKFVLDQSRLQFFEYYQRLEHSPNGLASKYHRQVLRKQCRQRIRHFHIAMLTKDVSFGRQNRSSHSVTILLPFNAEKIFHI